MIALGLFGLPMLLAASPVTPEPVESPASSSGQLPLGRDSAHRFVVQAKVNGEGPFTFLVDTGASRSVLSTCVAKRLAISPGGRVRTTSFTGTTWADTATVGCLQLGALRIAMAPVLLAEFAGSRLSGILGADILQSYRASLDMRARWLSLEQAEDRLAAGSSDGSAMNLPRLAAHVGGIPTSVVVDTGAQVSIGNRALMRALERRARLPNLEEAELSNFRGKHVLAKQARVDVDIGRDRLRNLPVVFADGPPFRAAKLSDEPALYLGMEAIEHFGVLTIEPGVVSLH